MEKKESKAFSIASFLLFGAVAFFPQHSLADPSGKIAAHSASGFLPVVLDVLLLLGIGFCFFSSLKVKSFLKDGEMAYGWALFSFSFAILFVAQLFSLSVSSGLFDIPLIIVSFVRLLSILSLALGIYCMKKVLS
jgi:hypothetical protein